MEKIRIGNDIGIRWEIYVRDGEDVAPYDLTGRTLKLYLSNMYQRLEQSEFSTDGNAVIFTFLGRDQRSLGRYRLTLVENDGAEGMHTVDECDAFELVRFSCLEGGNAESHVEIKRLTLASVMTMSGGGGGGPVDSELDPASPNAIANAAVTAAVTELSVRIENAIALSIPHDVNDDFNEDFAI